MKKVFSLLDKYNVPVPRYTSYPTVPYWDEIPPSQEKWKLLVKNRIHSPETGEGISLYLHLPFCESLCTYCGCNTRITVNHSVEQPYLRALLKEWKMYTELFPTKPLLKELHLGGGTPTFFSAAHLEELLTSILFDVRIAENASFSFEGHPQNTSLLHLETLHRLGFTRISLGIQDFDPKVQHIIHRIQTVQKIKEVTQQARTIGYTSVNFDLIYGLPLQTLDSMTNTIRHTVEMRPDRIAFYSYAHVPWIKPGQRKFTEADLPSSDLKRKLYETGKTMLLEAGYHEIGMDHFALPADSLYKAFQTQTLHRNFMGYTDLSSSLLIGLGASSISDAWNGFVQNEKKIEDYYARLENNEFPFFKGHVHTRKDLIIRKHVLNIMCKLYTSWEKEEDQFLELTQVILRLKEAVADGLIELTPHSVHVTASGKAFLRNICAAFDLRLHKKQTENRIFSDAV